MGINSPSTWRVNWPSNGVQLQQKSEFRIGRGSHSVELTQHSQASHNRVEVETRSSQARVEIETQSYSDPCLKRNMELLRPTFEVKRGVAQTRLKWNAELLRPAFELRRENAQELLRLAFEGRCRVTQTCIWSEMRHYASCVWSPHFTLGCEVHVLVEMRSEVRIWKLIFNDF